MSKNSKMRNKAAAAKQWTEQRKGGGKGPARTTKTNRKRNTWFAKLAGTAALMNVHTVTTEDGDSEVAA
jgi:hypothetical protein